MKLNILTGIFGISLNTSIQYAYVNISITNESGDSEVYGRIPVIVAKCGIYLKEKGNKLLLKMSMINKQRRM